MIAKGKRGDDYVVQVGFGNSVHLNVLVNSSPSLVLRSSGVERAVARILNERDVVPMTYENRGNVKAKLYRCQGAPPLTPSFLSRS